LKTLSLSLIKSKIKNFRDSKYVISAPLVPRKNAVYFAIAIITTLQNKTTTTPTNESHG